MGAAICGMHYTGMAAAIFPAYGTAMTTVPAMPDMWLAVTVAAFTFVLLATTLVVSVAHARHAREVAEHEFGAIALRALHDELEQRVHARTAELADANAALQAEVGEHERTEKGLACQRGRSPRHHRHRVRRVHRHRRRQRDPGLEPAGGAHVRLVACREALAAP